MDETTKKQYRDNNWPLPGEHVQAYSTQETGPDRCQHCKYATNQPELERNHGFCRRCRRELANY